MAKGRRSIIHFALAIDAGLRRAAGRDENGEVRPGDPDYQEATGLTLGGSDADDRPVLLDADAQAKLLAYLRGKVESDHLLEIAQFLGELRDDADAGEAEDFSPDPDGSGPGGVGAGFPKVGGSDARRRAAFDARFGLSRIQNLGGSGVTAPRPVSPTSGNATDKRFPEIVSALARIRVL